MVHLLAIWLLVGGLILSGLHSLRVIRRAEQPGVEVNALLAARREKRILVVALAAGLGHALSVLVGVWLVGEGGFWVVLAPFTYLVVYLLARWWWPL